MENKGIKNYLIIEKGDGKYRLFDDTVYVFRDFDEATKKLSELNRGLLEGDYYIRLELNDCAYPPLTKELGKQRFDVIFEDYESILEKKPTYAYSKHYLSNMENIGSNLITDVKKHIEKIKVKEYKEYEKKLEEEKQSKLSLTQQRAYGKLVGENE